MEKYSQRELDETVQFISSTINKCEKMKSKFEVGTSQHSLLKNRIKALYISRDLIKNDINIDMHTKTDLEKALQPVISIINKTEKAQIKYEEGTAQFKRFAPIIRAMYISKAFIESEISKEK
ncbi:hypothetical protein [Clostridium butyricum]|uniref:Uncharacterized protein n=1 Tax=Clostridium butyricum E4 str. BoNT E BL5262 TaxID=632245 RepID=C4IN07_CLOBU|nr:hypothetical protein [Clostridium butyricum]APF24903.1 hypothetical protein NPD4_530 [Clostridium butyricum]EDT74974.1 conserved hypothetical protein [Clostridium butyricum 5521]EEP52348.1 conserved hypothetical protein [Clostridium butyricum E4 str. BoNT E BL5262]NFL31490.1 hypothetical protein [Clostridium butyricum]NFS19188.1 hypothetical protein [Clostridium butyricum]